MKPASAPNYDFFKTLVASTLVTTLCLMLLSGIACAPADLFLVANTTEIVPTLPSPIEPSLVASPTDVLDASAVPPTVESTSQPATVVTTPSIAFVATEASTVVPEQATPTRGQTTTCNTSVPSRLSVEQTARVVQRVRLRNDASINAPLIQTNPPNTQVEIIGGPVCTPVGDRAYLWWQIRLADGTEGWSAESQLYEASYFLEPIP